MVINMENIRIQGEQIYLRPITIEDTDKVVAWRNDSRVVENFIYRKPITRQEHLNWMKNKVDTGKVVQFIICDNINDRPLGSVYAQNFDEENKKAEWGIFLGEEEAFGKGIGTEAGELFLTYLFKTYKLHKIISRVLAHNKGCIHMCEKLDCMQEAYCKDDLFLEGTYADLVWFGKINPEEV